MNRPKKFSPSRVVAVTWRILTQISRDKRTIAQLIIVPAIIMVIFGLVAGGAAKNLPILVEDEDTGYTIPGAQNSTIIHIGESILAALQTDERVTVSTGSFSVGKTGVEKGTYYAAISLPENLSKVLFLRNTGQNLTAPLRVYIDGTNPTIQATIMAALQSSLQTTFGAGGTVIEQQFAFGGIEFTGVDVSIPAVIGLILTHVMLLISIITIVKETTTGVLSRLYATPLSALERLLGFSLALLTLGVAMTCIVLAMGIGILGAIVQGSFALLFAGAILYALLNIFLAVFLSNFTKNELQAVQIVTLIVLPSMALSGMLIPVSSFPDWVQTVARYVPLYYANRVFEGVMLKGYGIENLAPQFLTLVGIALLFFVCAVITVRDRMPD